LYQLPARSASVLPGAIADISGSSRAGKAADKRLPPGKEFCSRRLIPYSSAAHQTQVATRASIVMRGLVSPRTVSQKIENLEKSKGEKQ
jgi:hypothetical protein